MRFREIFAPHTGHPEKFEGSKMKITNRNKDKQDFQAGDY